MAVYGVSVHLPCLVMGSSMAESGPGEVQPKFFNEPEYSAVEQKKKRCEYEMVGSTL